MTTLGGLPGNRTDYKFKVEVPKFLGSNIFDYTAFQVSAIKDDRLYTFTYFSTPEDFYLFLPIAQIMLSSRFFCGEQYDGWRSLHILSRNTFFFLLLVKVTKKCQDRPITYLVTHYLRSPIEVVL